jgi:hypothetical protein
MQAESRHRFDSFWALLPPLVVSFVCLAYPLYVIRPFRYQGARELAVALAVIRFRPFAEVACVAAALAWLVGRWQSTKKRSYRVLAAIGTLLVPMFALLSCVNLDELMFRPIEHPVFVVPAQLKLDPDEKVIAVKLGGVARAYPIRSISYHHVVNDVVNQVPIVATY